MKLFFALKLKVVRAPVSSDKNSESFLLLPAAPAPILLDIAGTNGQYLREPGTHQSGRGGNVEVTKALAALQPLYGKDNVEIITIDGRRIRGTVRSMKTTQALTTPSVKILCADGQIVKIPFPTIAEIKSHT